MANKQITQTNINTPFNDKEWSGNQLQNDGRWKYGKPPAGNASLEKIDA